MPCPRCGALLVEYDTSPEWLRFWVCVECDSAWHYADGVLQRGRNRPVRYPVIVDGWTHWESRD
jgi:hypothetical protein